MLGCSGRCFFIDDEVLDSEGIAELRYFSALFADRKRFKINAQQARAAWFILHQISRAFGLQPAHRYALRALLYKFFCQFVVAIPFILSSAKHPLFEQHTQLAAACSTRSPCYAIRRRHSSPQCHRDNLPALATLRF